ncbi:hypothetical protein LIPSTDRAFT_7526 [Lipomyces starkeyi NRRL Y-11557]|uniref:SWIM-type domain-containing protein n=1 Tax=Lipomyces starkeyi NRRL Y-11557 TaxID=675824 RepID=A0A1E3PTE3_LIPST|nr:hypothetical protein LIPSTDRAFT_7526 [Lipomyces starkeyi NRRL Y-11557]
MVKRHLLRHQLLPKVVHDCVQHPPALVYETYEEIHASSIREMLDYCRSIGQPKVFRYFWINWYRPEHAHVGSRWEIASMCGRRGSDAIIPISRTTMRLESHWRILKKDYVSRFIKPRLDILCYILFTDLVPSRIHLRLRVDAGREVPSAYKDFVQLWRRCANAIDSTTVLKRDELYHADKEKWVCSCLSFIFNSRYLCKHLVSFYSSPHPDGNGGFVVRPPPPFRPELFQERLPLINFSDVQLTGSGAVISSDIDLNGSVEDDARSLTYAEELESLQLLPTEHPEAAEENDEEAMEPLRVFGWAIKQCESNPRMQRTLSRFISNKEALMAQYKRQYDEALGISRSVGKNTMRKAVKSYFHMRDQNQSRTNRQ